ncbi:CidA/LrgA family protein [Acerihabitans sp. TG2]|uniref:CidA/LrgA family protein n=1 Tax=Acerihabitans sp. TG2 TaxID=3096008 RepID=UPI002B22CB29|nr:CidA/LrgA family protein [Acerihabitans sp. TG2]MEA9391585.1 CidA/LrgA family protein [Acerihabitans sp. TG2]
MPLFITHVWCQARAFLLIYACLYLGIGISTLLPITLPGSIIGMLVLFTLLSLQIIPSPWVKPGCHLLIRHMALLFVPIGVGVMQYFDVLRAQFAPVVISCSVSTLMVLITVSWCSHAIHKEKPVLSTTERKKGIKHAS